MAGSGELVPAADDGGAQLPALPPGVIASARRFADAFRAASTRAKEGRKAHKAANEKNAVRTDSGTMMRLNIDEVLQLAPRLRTYLTTSGRPGAISSMPPIGCAVKWGSPARFGTRSA